MAVAFLGLDKQQIAHSSVVTRTVQQVGGSFGTAVLAVILSSAITRPAQRPGRRVRHRVLVGHRVLRARGAALAVAARRFAALAAAGPAGPAR